MLHKLTFEWLTGSAADNMVKLFKALDIPYEHTVSGVCAGIGEGGEIVPVEYYRIEGNIYGITEKPQRTTAYFGLSPDVLARDKGDGYTKEECVLLDKNPEALPFCDTLLEALEKSEHYAAIGYDDIHILERINNRYAVIAYG